MSKNQLEKNANYHKKMGCLPEVYHQQYMKVDESLDIKKCETDSECDTLS